MAWTAITAAMTDADSPDDQTLNDRIRTNDQDHEDRINAFLVLNESSINEDFTTSALSSKFLGGLHTNGTYLFDSANHRISYTVNSSEFGGFAVELLPAYFSVRMNTDHKIVFESRIKITIGLDISEMKFVMGFQDVAIPQSGATCITDTTDYVGWIHGGTDDTTAFYAQDDGGGAQTGSDFGDVTAWTTYRVEVDATSAGTVWSARGYLDGVLKTTHTTAIPDAVHIRPVVGLTEVTGTSVTDPVCLVDYMSVWFAERSASGV